MGCHRWAPFWVGNSHTALQPLALGQAIEEVQVVKAKALEVGAVLGYLFAGLVNWTMLISLLTGSIPGIVVGSLLARRVSGRWIQIGLAIVLAAAGAKTLS